MKITNFFKILITTFVVLMAGISFSFATTGLNVVLLSQNPDPVSPGSFVYVNIKVSNTGSTAIKNADITFNENSIFTLASSEKATKELGTIPAYSNLESSTNFVVAKYKIFVNENTPLGLNTLNFKVNDDKGLLYNYDFEVLVQDSNPSIHITQFEVDQIEPGSSGKLKLELENDNTISLRNIVLQLGLSDVEDDVLSVQSGSNQKTITSLKAGEKKIVEFDIVASPDASSKPYLLPVDITYEDILGNSLSTQITGSVRVFSAPIVSIELDSQEIYSIGKGKITLAIANPGTSTIKGTQIQILPSEDYEVITGDYQYVGDLNPDDFQTVQSQIYVKNAEKVTLKIQVEYLDSYNNKKSEIIEMPMKTYNSEELKNLGLVSGSSSSSSSYAGIIFSLVLIGIAFYVGRRLGIKKTKKNNK